MDKFGASGKPITLLAFRSVLALRGAIICPGGLAGSLGLAAMEQQPR